MAPTTEVLLVMFAVCVSMVTNGVNCVSLEGCHMEDTACTFHLSVSAWYTMRFLPPGKVHIPNPDGKIYILGDASNTTISPDTVILADGHPKEQLLILANGQLPGPSIVVYEGQTVNVVVTNNLPEEGISIHYHGIEQRGTPWMDGAAGVTQCPILPGQTFTYTFQANRKGTNFYHGHVGAQLSMGLYGAFIVKEKTSETMQEEILILQDYRNTLRKEDSYVSTRFGLLNDNGGSFFPTVNIDGSSPTNEKLTSTLINGRGRVFNGNEQLTHTPLKVFSVQEGNIIRFRAIQAAFAYQYIMSVDNHRMNIVALDGHDIEPISVDKFIFHSGERVDFTINANKSVDNYWIRAVTMQNGFNYPGYAILRYQGANEVDPTTSKKDCTESDPCIIANCPFQALPNTTCIPVDSMKSAVSDDPAPAATSGRFKEFFLNFGFGLTPYGGFKGHVNGIALPMLPISPLTQPREVTGLCSDTECEPNKVCQCLKPISVELGDVVQLNILNIGFLSIAHHSIHTHGYSFHVLKVGYMKTNALYESLGVNPDIECGGTEAVGNSLCSHARWTDSSWYDGNIPDVDLARAPRKDTIIVPKEGYAVVRFVADNPGLWHFHCHMNIHNKALGMGFLLNDSFPSIPDPPVGFPECRNFPAPSWLSDTKNATGNDGETGENVGDGDTSSGDCKEDDRPFTRAEFFGVTGALLFVIVVQFIVAILCISRASSNKV